MVSLKHPPKKTADWICAKKTKKKQIKCLLQTIKMNFLCFYSKKNKNMQITSASTASAQDQGEWAQILSIKRLPN